MYIDPSRVDMLARYSARLAAATPEQLSALEGEVRLFIEALWTEASAEARARFLDAVRRVGPPMPWSAITAPPGAGEALCGARRPRAHPRPSRPRRRGCARLPRRSQERAGRPRPRSAPSVGSQTTLEAIGAPAGWNHPKTPPRDPVGARSHHHRADTNPFSNANSPTPQPRSRSPPPRWGVGCGSPPLAAMT
jgi:hypothetical protein